MLEINIQLHLIEEKGAVFKRAAPSWLAYTCSCKGFLDNDRILTPELFNAPFLKFLNFLRISDPIQRFVEFLLKQLCVKAHFREDLLR